jgi:hypothetical protein
LKAADAMSKSSAIDRKYNAPCAGKLCRPREVLNTHYLIATLIEPLLNVEITAADLPRAYH